MLVAAQHTCIQYKFRYPPNLTELERINRCKESREEAWVVIYPSPRGLGVQMVDVIRHCVVLKHRQVFLLEV